MSQIFLEPKGTDDATRNGRWMVTIFNNDDNSMQEVVAVLIAATNCGVEEAEIETWEAHVYGRAAVHFDTRALCEEVAAIIDAIGVRTQVSPEWEDA